MELLAPGRPIWVLASDTFQATRFESGNISVVGSWCCQACCECCNHLFPCCEHLFPCCEHFFHVANTFSHAANTFSMLRPPPSSPDIVYMLQVMLWVCCEHVTSLWRECCDQHPNIMLRTLFHVANTFPQHSVHVASDATSLWQACCELVASMLRACGEHVATTIQTSDARLMDG
jgi:hypothetical protein